MLENSLKIGNWKLEIILLLLIFAFAAIPTSAFAAERYWVGGTGSWSDDDTHWAATSGGAPADGNVPTSADNPCFARGRARRALQRRQ